MGDGRRSRGEKRELVEEGDIGKGLLLRWDQRGGRR